MDIRCFMENLCPMNWASEKSRCNQSHSISNVTQEAHILEKIGVVDSKQGSVDRNFRCGGGIGGFEDVGDGCGVSCQ